LPSSATNQAPSASWTKSTRRLDEANVGRFTRLIGEMSGQTQFIIVTHNRKTMEMGSVLYGVTMQEPGVSKLVSVRWEESEALAPKQQGRRCLCSIKSHSALNVGAQHAAPLPPANEALRHPRKPHKFFLMLHCNTFFGCATWKGQHGRRDSQ